MSENSGNLGQLGPEILLTADEVAALLKVKPSWVKEMGRQGRLPRKKIGHYVRFSRVEIEEWVSQQSSEVENG